MATYPSARRLAALLALSVSLSLGACKGKEAESPETPPVGAVKPFNVTNLALGDAIDASKIVASPKTVFDPDDTIYAVVSSEGAASSATIAARWTYEDGQVVNESTQLIAPTGPTATEFHIVKPDGWPKGRYKVEISANGAPSLSAEFEVR